MQECNTAVSEKQVDNKISVRILSGVDSSSFIIQIIWSSRLDASVQLGWGTVRKTQQTNVQPFCTETTATIE
jgi:hypothetical protein